MPLFERIVMVDWSAAAVPTTGRDSIWIASVGPGEEVATPSNPATREAAMEIVRGLVADRERVLVGFDFAFGYPEGTAHPFGGRWSDVWSWLADQAADGSDNGNDRFHLAARFNARFPDVEGPLWGLPRGRAVAGVTATKPPGLGEIVPERRRVERIVRNAQPTGKLAYPGSVGSQTLLGIARLERWRRDGKLGARTRIWPFETGFADEIGQGIVVAEIFPSLHPIRPRGDEVRDEAQVRTLAEGYARLDRDDGLRPHLAGPARGDDRTVAMREEGWIMSVGDHAMALAA